MNNLDLDTLTVGWPQLFASSEKCLTVSDTISLLLMTLILLLFVLELKRANCIKQIRLGHLC